MARLHTHTERYKEEQRERKKKNFKHRKKFNFVRRKATASMYGVLDRFKMKKRVFFLNGFSKKNKKPKIDI